MKKGEELRGSGLSENHCLFDLVSKLAIKHGNSQAMIEIVGTKERYLIHPAEGLLRGTGDSSMHRVAEDELTSESIRKSLGRVHISSGGKKKKIYDSYDDFYRDICD